MAHSFLHQIAQNTNHEYVLVLSSTLALQINSEIFGNNFKIYIYDIKSSAQKSILSQDKFLDNLVKKHNVARVFSVFGPSYWRPKVNHTCGYAKPHYVYKKSPFFKTISLKDRFKLKLKEFFHLYDFKKNADVLITENPDVSAKIKVRLKKEVYTVTNNYNQIFDKPEFWKFKELPKFDGEYLLTIAANYPHKNLKIIPKVVQELINRDIHKFRFAVTLNRGDLKSNEQIDKYIVYLGKVEVNECPSLYKQSKYMFLPTLLECFSASYAEAMKMKNIILTSNLDFAIGICGDAAVYYNALDPISIVDELIKIDSDQIKQKEIIAKGIKTLTNFDSAKERAVKYLDIVTK